MGRPRQFDYATALQHAMLVFWEKGFDGASMRDLTGAMGITGPSLYAAFGDKTSLYLKALDHYTETDGCTPLTALEGEEDIEAALQAFLAEVIHTATDHESGVKGCFVATSAVAAVGQVEGVAERIQAVIDEAEHRLAARFLQEIEKGRLPSDFPAKARASLLLDLRQGYMFRGRAGCSSDQMLAEVPDRVRMILSV